MPGALGAAVRAKYRDAFISAPENQKGRREEKEGFWYFRFQFALFAISSKLPIPKNYQCHKMAATEKTDFYSPQAIAVSISQQPRGFRLAA